MKDTENTLREEIKILIKKYLEKHPKHIMPLEEAQEGCSWEHWNACSFECFHCMTYLMYESYIYKEDYIKGKLPKVKNLKEFRDWLKKKNEKRD